MFMLISMFVWLSASAISLSAFVMHLDGKVFCTTEENRSRHAYDSVTFTARVALLDGLLVLSMGPQRVP